MSGGDPALHPCYTGFFQCFNEARYYEAHDILEHLWLQGPTTDSAFYKGLIQFAGAYVHIQKQHLRPQHPKDGRRLRPAFRLFALVVENLAPYAPRHLRLDVNTLLIEAGRLRAEIEAGGFLRNPWSPERPPRIELDGGD